MVHLFCLLLLLVGSPFRPKRSHWCSFRSRLHRDTLGACGYCIRLRSTLRSPSSMARIGDLPVGPYSSVWNVTQLLKHGRVSTEGDLQLTGGLSFEARNVHEIIGAVL